MSLNERALLTQLQISQWSARRFDKKTSRMVANNFGVAEQVGRYNKSLLPGAEALALVHAKATYIRTIYYKNTLPWGIEGTQILPCDNYLTFIKEYNEHRNEWQWLVDQFVKEYPDLVVNARNTLGGLFNLEDYPHHNHIRDRFYIDLAVFPVPSTDFRVSVMDSELQRIKIDIEARVAHAQNVALGEAWQRLYDRVKTVYDKIVDPTSIFRDSLIENVRETCDLLGRMNITNDPQFEAMRQEVMHTIAGHDPETLRRDLDQRSEVADEVKTIMDKMRAFMA